MSEWMNMNEWMNEYEWVNEWIWMSEWMNMNEWMNEYEWVKEWIWMSEGMNEWVKEWMNEWVNECAVQIQINKPFSASTSLPTFEFIARPDTTRLWSITAGPYARAHKYRYSECVPYISTYKLTNFGKFYALKVGGELYQGLKIWRQLSLS